MYLVFGSGTDNAKASRVYDDRQLKCLLAVNEALRQLVEQQLTSLSVPNSQTP